MEHYLGYAVARCAPSVPVIYHFTLHKEAHVKSNIKRFYSSPRVGS